MLVGMVPSIKLESLLKLITSLLEVSSSMKGQVSNGSSLQLKSVVEIYIQFMGNLLSDL